MKSRRTGLYYHPIFLKHDTGEHPESAKRLDAIMQSIQGTPELEGLQHFEAKPATSYNLEQVHHPQYIKNIKSACAEGVRFIGTKDCVVSPESYDAALIAAGSAIDAVLQVAQNKLDNAFCAVRPPGHHAEYDQAMGFCYFNNVAVAAEFLVHEFDFKRVLIFDFDVHHGNGTQHAFEERKDVFYCSIHQDPRTSYPGTGFEAEEGFGDGQGYTLNVNMPAYSDDQDYWNAFSQKILPRFKEYKPEFIILSAGFDAHRDDPLAQQQLTQEGYQRIMESMMELADEHAQGRMVSILEGGYHTPALAACVQNHLIQLHNL